MKLSASQAAKSVGKSVPTITRAIKSGKLSANKLNSGGYEIDPSELYRVWPAVTFQIDETSTMLGSVTPKDSSGLEREVELLRERIGELKEDRDQWREQAQKVTALVEDHSEKKGFLKRLFS